ncbi:MAG: hypothetical protein ACWGQW_03665 [bacterium]
MGSGVSRVMTGAVRGTGAVLPVRTVGFRPQRVELFNRDGLVVCSWQESMPDDSMMKQVTAGTISFVTSGGITPLSNGFQLGADVDANVADELVDWAAYQ